LPVPTINRDLKARPAMISSSDIGIPTGILDLRGLRYKSEGGILFWEARSTPKRAREFS
jgi:hypothetical protein